MPTVLASPAGVRGFDCNAAVSAQSAAAMFAHGYRFAVRYVRRLTAHAGDLTADEVTRLHAAGLAVMPVQHVESETAWVPSAEKGATYGANAAAHAHEAGLPAGVTLWLDLEGVDVATPAEIVIAYCNRWHDAVAAAGYQPGIYVGWHAILDARALYERLRFSRYWAAYNLNRDREPATRGVCMRQHAAKPSDKPAGLPFEIDVDTIGGDALGGFPMVYAPDEWAATCAPIV